MNEHKDREASVDMLQIITKYFSWWWDFAYL